MKKTQSDDDLLVVWKFCVDGGDDPVAHAYKTAETMDAAAAAMRTLVLYPRTRVLPPRLPLASCVPAAAARVCAFLRKSTAERASDESLATAVRRRRAGDVAFLLECRANPNAGNSLLLAAQFGRMDIAKLLIDARADVNGESERPLHFACASRAHGVARVLLEHGADVSSHSVLSETVDRMPGAAFVSSDDANALQEYLRLLIEQKAPLETTAATAEHRRSVPVLHYVIRNGLRDCTTLLLNHSADINVRCPTTTLHTAAFRGNIGVLETLLSRGADTNTRDTSNRTTALFHAYDARIARFLIAHGADVHARCIGGETALYHAADNCAHSVCAVLIAHGAKADDVNVFGTSPLQVAAAQAAVYKNDCIETMRLLLDNGANVNLAEFDPGSPLDQVRRPPFTVVLRSNYINAVDFLIARKADLRYVEANTGNNFLHRAAIDASRPTVEYLVRVLEKNGLLDDMMHAKNADGKTPTECAEKRDVWTILHAREFGRVGTEARKRKLEKLI